MVGTQIRQAIKRGTQIIVVDPRKIDLVKDAVIHMPIKAGTNIAFANAMIHVIIKEGLADMDYIRERTEGFEELAEIVKDYTPEKVAEICHIDAEDIRKAARMYARAKKSAYHLLPGSHRAYHGDRGRYEPVKSCHGGRENRKIRLRHQPAQRAK